MTRRLIIPFLCLLALLLASGCEIHELPEGDPIVNLTLELKYDQPYPQYKTSGPVTKDPETQYVVRYVVQLFKYDSDVWNQEPAYTLVEYGEDTQNLDRTISLVVEPSDFHAIVWTDFVEASSLTPFYSADDFADVKLLTASYQGCESMRDCYFGFTDLPLAELLVNNADYSETMEMHHPVARYNFVSTDREQFIEFLKSRMPSSIYKPDGTLASLEEFSIRVIYPQYLPSVFNLHSGRPVDSALGVQFYTNLVVREDGDVEMGFDYVFVNETESKVIVSLEIYDYKGNYISSVNNLEVVLMRGRNTTVQGTILTSGVDSGVRIDAEYEGEFNIIIS